MSFRLIPLVLLLPFLIPGFAVADWLHWRGPNQNNTVKDAGVSYPVQWSEEKNIAWKTALKFPGNSSPISDGKTIFLTESGDAGKTRSFLGFDLDSGKKLWQRDVKFAGSEATHKTNQWSSATPFFDTDFGIFVWHGSAGLYAYDFNGDSVHWKRDLGIYSHQWGANAGSPLVKGDRVFLHAGPGLRSVLFCLEKLSGKTIWKKELPTSAFKEFKGSWATPVLRENGSRTEIIVPLSGMVKAFDAENGKELWHCEGLGDLCYTDPLISKECGQVVYMSGYGGPAMSFKLPGEGESGNITESHRLWVYPPDGKGRKNPQRIGTGQIVGDYIYMVNAPGIAECIDLKTGAQIWKQRFTKPTWSGLSLVNGLFYIIDQTSTTYVFKANSEGLELLHTNHLGGNQKSNSTLAFVDGSILIRTHSNLYCIRGR